MSDRSDPHYIAVIFETGAGIAETWADALLAAGALSVDAADAGAGTASEVPAYGDPAGPPWPRVRLTALFEDDVAWEAMVAGASAAVGEAPDVLRTARVEATDWVRHSQAQFEPLRVSERLWIVPSWRSPPANAAAVVTLDPGLAFGTGSHPSTILCLRWLGLNLGVGESVLDYGCGSGILAIAAEKLGAAKVVGVDIDPQAIATSRANAQRNAVAAVFGAPDQFEGETFDVVVANILANPLELLAPLLAGRVRMGGHVVLSGILEAQTPAVLAAYTRWFNIAPWGSMEGWVALAGVRHAG